jgi:hypothetical protein
MKKATDMSNTPETAWDRDIGLEDLAAELTSAVYPVVLGFGPKELWVKVELGLWRALGQTVKRWTERDQLNQHRRTAP